MRYNDLIQYLKQFTSEEITMYRLATILNTHTSKIKYRKDKNGKFSQEEVQIIVAYFKNGTNIIQTVQNNTTNCIDCYEIPYWEGLPEDAKLTEITSIHVDVELVENHWHRKPENLVVIPMQGDCLSTYVNPIYNRDALIVDINSNTPAREGIYVYSAMNNTMLFVAKVSQLMDGTIKIEKFEMNGEITQKLVSVEEQKRVDFRVIGRVVKNVSSTL